MDTFEALDAAVSAARPVVEATTTAQFDLATPCTEWDVRGLLNHIVGTLWLADALLTDTAPAFALGSDGLPDRDLVGDNPAAAYKEAGEGARAAARSGGALAQTH